MKFFAACLILVASAFAISADEAMAKSKAWFSSSKSWSFDFSVETVMSQSASVGSQRGSMLVSEGNKFRLSIPGITFISDGTNYWQWNEQQNQVLIKLVEDLEATMHPSELLFKYLNCKALSIKEEAWRNGKVWALTLSPSAYAGQFVEMEVWLSQKDFSPVRLFTVDEVGNSSWYDISKLKVVKKVSDADFTFKASAGVDEIDMR